MKQLKLTITGEINWRLYDEILEKVTSEKDAEEIVLIINSIGGNVNIGLALYDLLKSLNVKIITVALGSCYSMATILFALGERRYISENTEYMLHQTSYTFGKDAKVSSGELREMTSAISESEERCKKILESSGRNGIADFINKVYSSKNNVFLSAKQAITMGFATDEFKNLNDILK